MPVPDDIDDALLGLGRQAGLSSVLRSLEAALDLAVSNAFQRSPPYPTDVTKTLDLLRACLTFTGSRSASSGDKLELPRLQRLAAMLQERLAPPSPQPPPAVWIAHEATSRKMEPRAPTAARSIRVRPPAPPARVDPERVARLVSAILSKLSSLYELRQHLLADPLATWRDFRTVDRQLQDAIHAVRWLAGRASELAKSLLVAAQEEADGFAAATALLHAGGDDDLASLLVGPLSVAGVADGVLTALRLSDQASLWQELGARAPQAPSTIAVRVSSLADRGELSADMLVELLGHDNDALAIRAAELLAWLGRPPADARALENCLRREISEARVFPFLYAAIVLGSAGALAELRRRLIGRSPRNTQVTLLPAGSWSACCAIRRSDARRLTYDGRSACDSSDQLVRRRSDHEAVPADRPDISTTRRKPTVFTWRRRDGV